MKRSFLISSIIITGLISCKDNTAHRPADQFLYTISNTATLIDGKDTITWPVQPGITVTDHYSVDPNHKPCRIIKIDTCKFKYIILPKPCYYITNSRLMPEIFKAYSSGDTLILCHEDTLHPNYHARLRSYKNSKRAKAIDFQTGDVISWKVEDTCVVGDSIYDYKILTLAPYIESLAVEFSEKMDAISSDSTHPDLVQINEHGIGVKLGFYHQKKMKK